MKGNGRIVGFLIVIVLVLVMVVLNFTTFIVSNINVLSEIESPIINRNSIILSSGIGEKENIFFLNEKNISNRIESTNPYIKVTNIERKFPSTVNIYVGIREGLINIKIKNGNYAILDSELRILEISKIDDDVLSAAVPVLGLELDSCTPGDLLDATNDTNRRIKEVTTTATEMLIDGNSFLAFFEKIDVLENGDIYVHTNSGVTICLFKDYSATEQFRSGLRLYQEFNQLDARRSTGYYYLNERTGVVQWFENVDR